MSYDLMFQKAIDLQNAGALNEAESIYLRLLQTMPENSDVWNLLGLVAQSKGDMQRAIDCFLAAIKYAPRPFFAHYFNLGLSYKALNKKSEALHALKKAVDLAPDTKELWNYLGVLQAENGEMNDAVNCFCRALEIDEHYEEARANLCFFTNDVEELIKLADEEKNDFYVNFRAGLLVDDIKKKERYLQRAVEIAPERTDGLLALANFYRQKENLNKALIFYHKVLNLDENDVSALLGVADIYLAEKDYPKAEKFYLKSFEQTREIAGAYLNYGILLYQTGRIAEALDAYRKAVVLAPETPEISYNLALILKETGDLEEALGLMFNAHLKAPENQVFIINIAETLTLLFKQNAEMALKIAENWLKLEPDNVFSKRLFAGMSGGDVGDEDAIYSKQLFDAFAENYDFTMDKLESNIISTFKELNGEVRGRILDLGCGTGLAGARLKSDDSVWIGVDISQKMLEQARLRGIYQQLISQDIISFLEENPPAREYDMTVAFDVFCYFGDLSKVISRLCGCEVWFSIEKADEELSKNYYLTANGRYKHQQTYVYNLLKNSGFKEIEAHLLTLRKENGEDVCGVMFHAK